MKRKIAMVACEKKYMERMQQMWNKYYEADITLYGATSIDELETKTDLDELDLIMIDEKYIQQDMDKIIFLKKGNAIIYLTEISSKENKGNHEVLYKYQQVSHIYAYVKDWMRRNVHYELNTYKDEKKQLSYKYGDPANINHMDLQILKNINIDLVPISDVQEGSLLYNLEELVLFEEFCKRGLKENNAWDLICQICSVLRSLEDYLLDVHHISLQLSHIYYHENTNKIKLLYIPLTQEVAGKNFMMDLEKIIQFILHSIEESSTIHASGQNLFHPQTVVFSNLQEAAEQSRKRIVAKENGETTLLMEREAHPYLIRKSTGEKIWIRNKIFKIGKDRKMVDYCIGDNPAISKNHADIKIQDGSFFVVDHHSLNATMLNGKIIPPEKWMELKDEDCLIFANEKFDFYKNDIKES